MTTPLSPIRIALIGTGVFARDAHLPSLRALPDAFEIVAVCARSAESVESLLGTLPPDEAARIDICDDTEDLLARDDIDALDVVVPIHLLPDVVGGALHAGKHVFSEKPIAPTLAAARRLLHVYRELRGWRVWMVGENWRYEPAILRAAELIAEGAIGRALTCNWALNIPMQPENKYYQTEWRRAGQFPGGYLVDGGVHHVAALRAILGEITAVSAITTQVRADLPPADTLSAVLEFDGGVQGTYNVTFAAGAPWPATLDIVGTDGALRVERSFIELARGADTGRIEFPPHQSVRAELAAFAGAVRAGEAHRNSPEEALRDLAVIEALLESAEAEQRVRPDYSL